ncbi:uncharacterized protein LOC110188054 [Drosophila serrata]|uniref:uncharacterized protein LOC110188054 n=1 Tax=Drosophila serrata TaxID=7274 RepID=UPI000A1D28F9|nr:uncharacterized protein LOC110188054 [Drosophila serrata]
MNIFMNIFMFICREADPKQTSVNSYFQHRILGDFSSLATRGEWQVAVKSSRLLYISLLKYMPCIRKWQSPETPGPAWASASSAKPASRRRIERRHRLRQKPHINSPESAAEKGKRKIKFTERKRNVF